MKSLIKGNKTKILICICLIALAGISVVQGCRNAMTYPMGSFDFQYDSAKYIALGIDPYEESLNPTGLQKKLNLEYYYGGLEANQFPSMLMMLIPFTFFPPMTANFLFLVFNLGCTLGILVLLKKLFLPDDNNMIEMICLIFIFLFGTPWRNNIGNGQHTIFAFFFFMFCLYLSNKNYRINAGISLAISFFKYTLTVPMALYLVYKRRIKELIVAVSIHGILTVLASFWLKMSIVDLIMKPLRVASHLAGEGSYDINSIFHLGEYGMIVTAILIILVFIYAVVGKFPGNDEELLALLTIFSLVIVYHRIYDYFVLIIPFIVFVLKKRTNLINQVGKLMLCICVAYVSIVNKIITIILPSILEDIDSLYSLFLYSTMIILAIGIYKNQNVIDG